jgi:hypothetical protein
MRTRILTLAALIFALESTIATAQTLALPANLRTASPALVIDRLLAGREVLQLTTDQANRLTHLATRLRHDRGRLVIAGLDRAPGKSVPRIERKKTTAAEAFRQASAVLSGEQVAKAVRLLAGPGR